MCLSIGGVLIGLHSHHTTVVPHRLCIDATLSHNMFDLVVAQKLPERKRKVEAVNLKCIIASVFCSVTAVEKTFAIVLM